MLARRTRGHDDALAGPLARRVARVRLSEEPFRRDENRLGLAHPTRPLARPFGESADLRADKLPTALREGFDVRGRGRIRVHRVVHGRRRQDRPVSAREEQRREHVVRHAHRGPREDVRRRRRHDNEIGILGEIDVGQRAAALP